MDHSWTRTVLLSSALALGAPVFDVPKAESQTQDIVEATASKLQSAGQYEEAIIKGREEATLDGYLAAAKAGLFLAAYAETDRKTARALLKAANQDALKAVAIDPDHIDANLQLTIAEGYEARIKTSPKRAKAARKRAEWLAGQAPENGYVLGLLGGWHGEAVAAYGALIAKVTVGANAEDFEHYFDKAIAAAPNNPLIIAYYVRLLLDINGEGMREKAGRLLINIETAESRDAFEAFMKDRAIALKTALAADDKRALKDLIKAQRPFRGQK